MNNRKHKSFTLLELLIVILIVGIISSLVVPGFYSRYQGQKFQNYCYRVVGFFKKAQNRAVVEGQIIEVDIQPSAIILAIPTQEENRQIIGRYSLPERYRWDTDIDKVYFYPSGEFRIISGGDWKEEGIIELSSGYGKNKIYLWAGSGNVFLEK